MNHTKKLRLFVGLFTIFVDSTRIQHCLFPKYYLYLLAAELVLVSNHCFIVLNFLYIFILSCLLKLLIIDWYFWTILLSSFEHFFVCYIFLSIIIYFLYYICNILYQMNSLWFFPWQIFSGSWMKKKTERKRERERGEGMICDYS